MIGSHMIKTWSKTQANIALSSAESEFYATMKGAQESLGVVAMAAELGEVVTVKLSVDASAALGVAQRVGIGKIRHLQTGALWIQEQELKRRIQLGKVNGSDNISDIATKNVPREILERHIQSMCGEFRDGRAGKTVQLQCVSKRVRQLKCEIKSLKTKVETSVNQVSEEDIDAAVDNFENFILDVEDEVKDRVRHRVEKWKSEQCRQIGESRSHLLKQLLKQ